jgi:enamine deaminase RidA (YjgF/YER057c/UK114 family)
MGAVSDRLAALGLALPPPIPTVGRYASVNVHCDLAYTSGLMAVSGPPLQIAYAGRVGDDLSTDEAKLSARGALLSTLVQLETALGDLDRIETFLHVRGFVRVAPGFEKVHHVVGAANALIAELFGDDRLAGRTAVGVAELPEGASVVLETVAAITPSHRP